MERRRFLTAAAAAVMVGGAGCGSPEDGGDGGDAYDVEAPERSELEARRR